MILNTILIFKGAIGYIENIALS